MATPPPPAPTTVPTGKKLKVGWFTFSCCEDSTILMTELMNEHWQEWKQLLDIRHARVLQSHNVLDELDVAFVEGALASPEHVAKLKAIRAVAKKLVAIGACAVMGLPSAQRDQFDPARLAEIEPIMARFAYMPHVKRLSDVVTVDAEVPGCPMDEKRFLQVLNDALHEFGVTG